MSRRLQDTSFDRSGYERPDQDWVCGHSGNPCPLGPGPAGQCNTTHACVPYREGDRWACARPAQFEGPCERGPLPDGTCCNPIPRCQPERSLRARRGRTARWVISLTVGLLAFSLAGERSLDFIFPGPVTHHHGTVEKDCTRCHAAAGGGFTHWVTTGLAGTDRASDSERCLDCHDLGPSSTIAHSIDESELAKITDRVSQASRTTSRPFRFALARLGPGTPVRETGGLACAVCHQEHQGAEHDLTKLTNDQCQVCHLEQFDRFAQDHPPLGVYPYGRRTRIIFNHRSHLEDYFPDEEREDLSCVSCHAPDPTGRTMGVNDFTATCGDCHDDDVRTAGKGGIAFINLPALDVRGLRRTGIDPGQWPNVEKPRATSPFVSLLLADDERLSDDDRKAILELGSGPVSVSDLSQFERLAIGRWAWTFKQLLFDLRGNGHAAIEGRLLSSRLTGDARPTKEALGHLTNSLDRETIRVAIDQWFPDLTREIEAFRRVTEGLEHLDEMDTGHWAKLNSELRDLARQRVGRNQRASTGNSGSEERWVRQGGWYRTSRDAAIRYRSHGHADPFVRAWFDLATTYAHTSDPGGDAAGAAQRLFEGLRASNASGSCVLCHSIDPATSESGSSGRSHVVNWKPFTPDPNRKPATEFRHRPHFSLDDASRCDTCHRMREADEDVFEEAYADDADPSGHLLDFEPIGLATCGDCHTRRAAGDDCVTCHNYHLGETQPIHLTATTIDSAVDEGDTE